MEQNLDITNPRYYEQISPVPWFHCNRKVVGSTPVRKKGQGFGMDVLSTPITFVNPRDLEPLDLKCGCVKSWFRWCRNSLCIFTSRMLRLWSRSSLLCLASPGFPPTDFGTFLLAYSVKFFSLS